MPVLGLHDAMGHADDTPTVVKGESEDAAEVGPVVIDARRGDAGKHSHQVGRCQRAGEPLVVAEIAAALGGDLAGGPGLLGGPFDRVVAVAAFVAKGLPFSF